MLRVENGKLFVVLLLVKETDNIWNSEEAIKVSYWVLIDVSDNRIIEFNKTDDKDYVSGELINKELNDHKKEIFMYFVDKKLKYK